MIASESALIAPATTRAYGPGWVRSNKFARTPVDVGTDASSRRNPGMLSAFRAPAGTMA